MSSSLPAESRFVQSVRFVAVLIPIGGGKTVDVVAENGKESVAIEIEAGRADAAANVRKCLEAGFDRAICCPVTTEVKQEIRCAFAQEPAHDSGLKLIQAHELVAE